jgi:transposase
LAAIDAQLAAAAPGWNALSRRRVTELVDWRVRALDPAAERVVRDRAEDRHVEIGPSCDGVTQFWGALRTADAAVFDRRLDAVAATVCGDDSRTKRQRRADAVAVLAAAGQTVAREALVLIARPGVRRSPVAHRVDLLSADQVVALIRRREAMLANRSSPPCTEEVGHCQSCAFRSQCEGAGRPRRP